MAGTTDARAMQITRQGVLAGATSVACRYVHSACETVSLADCEAAAKLLSEFCATRLRIGGPARNSARVYCQDVKNRV